MRYDLTSLKIFVSVAECGNLTRAAEREHLAVSAISKRIGELEALVRTPLLLRRARGVELTPAGQSLLHHARQLLQVVHRMDEELGEYAGGVKGHVRMHAVASALTEFLPEDLESFLSRYPLVEISLEGTIGRCVACWSWCAKRRSSARSRERCVGKRSIFIRSSSCWPPRSWATRG